MPDPRALSGEELAALLHLDATPYGRALLAHIAVLEGQVTEAREEVRRLWELGSRHEQESLRLADENVLWKQRAEEAERQRDALRDAGAGLYRRGYWARLTDDQRIAIDGLPGDQRLWEALRDALTAADPTWRDAPPRVADGEGT